MTVKLPVNHVLFRIFPHPLMSFIVSLSWLMLQHSLSLGNVLLALILGWAIAKMMQRFVVRTPDIQWFAAFKLFGVVLWDVVLSNIRVAKMILSPMDQLQPKWFRVPLQTQHEQVNSLLAMIITTTPGTVSAGIDQQRGDILVHSLHTLDTQQDIAEIKQRYEQPLIEIFHAQSDLSAIQAKEEQSA